MARSTNTASAAERTAQAEKLESYGPKVGKLLVMWEWTQRQVEALLEIAQFLLYGGAKGGGKTVFLCRWAVLQCAIFPGNKIFLCRKRFVDFKTTTLETFKRVIPPTLYHHNKNEKRFYLPWCNGIIEYGGLDQDGDVDKFNSYECGGIGVDQAEEITQDLLGSMVGSLRLKLPDGSEPSYQVRLSANPAECFLKYKFLERPAQGDPKTGKGRYVFIQALHSDNPFLPSSYVQNLKDSLAHRPNLLAAYIDGSWDNLAAMDVLIQPSWVSAAKSRIWTAGAHARKRVLGGDIARHGEDESSLHGAERSFENQIRFFYHHHEGYTDNVIDLGDRWMAKTIQTKSNLLVLDAVGIGAGVFDYVRRKRLPGTDKPFPVLGYVAGDTKSIPDLYVHKYTNLKSMAWHLAADDFRSGIICLHDDPVLSGQLLWQKTVLVNELKQRVLTRKELREKYNASPDRAESVIMTLHGLRVSSDLPDERPISPATEFWDIVKKDKDRYNRGDSEDDGWTKLAA